MPTFLLTLAFTISIIVAVTVLVRRDRQQRDLDRRALLRAIAKLTVEKVRH